MSRIIIKKLYNVHKTFFEKFKERKPIFKGETGEGAIVLKDCI